MAKKNKAFSFKTSERVKVRFSIESYTPRNGDTRVVVDMRTYVIPHGGDDFIPTQKGCQIPVEKLDSLIEKLQVLRDSYNSR